MRLQKNCPGYGSMNSYIVGVVPVLDTSGVDPKPEAPTNPVVSGTPMATAATLTWTPSTGAMVVAPETYTLFCMTSSAASCDIALMVGNSSAVGVPRTTTSGTVGALTAGTTYKCCVQAKNAGGVTYNPTPTSLTTPGK